MNIIIPSKGRVGKVETLKLIPSGNSIYLFVEPQESKLYRNEYWNSCSIVELKENNKGIAYSRNSILEYFKNLDEPILMLDDDISNFQKRDGKTSSGYHKLVKMDLDEVDKMFKELSLEFIKNNLTQLTISFAPSNWLENKAWKSPSRVWCFNMINPKKLNDIGIKYDNEADLMEDYDITAQILSKGGLVASSFNYAFTPIDGGCGKSEGGCQSYRNSNKSQETVEYLFNKWGNKVRSVYVPKKDIMEVQFLWSKFIKK